MEKSELLFLVLSVILFSIVTYILDLVLTQGKTVKPVSALRTSQDSSLSPRLK